MYKLRTSIHRSLPWAKWHDIIILQNDCQRYKYYAYAIDFTPIIDYRNENASLLKMILGKKIEGEIRLRKIKFHKYIEKRVNGPMDIERINFEYITDELNIENKRLTIEESYEESKKIRFSIKDPKINELMDYIFSWSTYFQLYEHNCQHFSNMVLSTQNRHTHGF